MEQRQEELAASKGKCLELLDKMDGRLSSIESSALRFFKSTPADQLVRLKNRTEREKLPGYFTRLMILDELLHVMASRSVPAAAAAVGYNNNNYLDASRSSLPAFKVLKNQ